AEQPQNAEELEDQLQEARAATQQWKAKYSRAKREMDVEAARLLAEQEKRRKAEAAQTQAEADLKALKEEMARLQSAKEGIAKELEEKTTDLKETAGALEALKTDVEKRVKEKTAEEL
ncbi:hypothetical protein LINPERHAP1_LOCUS682, partial [Linum perenne]